MAGYIGKSQSITQVDGYNKAEADDTFVNAAGDTMTGDLNVTGTVTSDGFQLGAGEKLYFNADRYFTPENNVDGAEVSANGKFTVKTGATPNKSLVVDSTGDISFYEDTGTTAKFFWDASAETLLLGATSTLSDVKLHVDADGDQPQAVLVQDTSNLASIVGTYYRSTTEGRTSIASGGVLTWYTDGSTGTERMRIDSSGNLLVGTTSTSHQDGSSTEGFTYLNGSYAAVSRSGGVPLYINRQTSDGDIVEFRKDGATVGSIGVLAGTTLINAGTGLVVGGGTTGLKMVSAFSAVYAANPSTAASLDNVVDLGLPSVRFDDVYATNGTIQTSDEREKQDVAVLTPTEMLVAKRISGLFKTFRWIDAVEEKGADARIHSGVIAQEVKAAFEAEGLDAGRYAFFIHTTWWETTEVIPAVEAKEAVLDEEGNVLEEAIEAQEERTVVHTHDTAVEGGVERDRMGVRYPQLLAFVAAYNDQRMASIEARLDALEAN